jgi:hypothetical protein
MRALLRNLVLVAAAAGFFAFDAPVARATIVTWSFSGAGFDDGGTVSGRFSVYSDPSFTAIIYNNAGGYDYSILSTPGSHTNLLGYQLPGSVYSGPQTGTPVDSPSISPSGKTVDFYENGASYAGIFLQLTFANPLTAPGPNSIVSGFECGVGFPCPAGIPDSIPTRYINSFGVTSAVPEPATWAMMVLGFLGLGFIAYRRTGRTSGSSFRFT